MDCPSLRAESLSSGTVAPECDGAVFGTLQMQH